MELHERHPLSSAMRERVLDELARIERERNVRVLYACESGSRAWGFASTDSDYDVRFVYVEKPEWFIQVDAGRDVIERPLDDELDISGWELRKTLGLLRKSNPTLLEWLDSPLVYRSEPAATARLRELAEAFYSPPAAVITTCRWPGRTFAVTCKATACGSRSTSTCSGRCWRCAGSIRGAAARR